MMLWEVGAYRLIDRIVAKRMYRHQEQDEQASTITDPGPRYIAFSSDPHAPGGGARAADRLVDLIGYSIRECFSGRGLPEIGERSRA